jgi:phosphoserine aminotransferase
MTRKHNFGAGPGILPESALKQAAQAVLDFNGSGMSILEISHRSKDFDAVMDKTKSLVRELLGVPKAIQSCSCRVVPAHNSRWSR